jgi:hypothetical protein
VFSGRNSGSRALKNGKTEDLRRFALIDSFVQSTGKDRTRRVTLPVELYQPTLENLDRKSLLNVVVASHDFQVEAERLLHRSVSLGPLAPRAIEQVRRILATPRFFVFIRALKADSSVWRSHSPTGLDEDVALLINLLCSLLEKLSNLVQLHIDTRTLGPRYSLSQPQPHVVGCKTVDHSCRTAAFNSAVSDVASQ